MCYIFSISHSMRAARTAMCPAMGTFLDQKVWTLERLAVTFMRKKMQRMKCQVNIRSQRKSSFFYLFQKYFLHIYKIVRSKDLFSHSQIYANFITYQNACILHVFWSSDMASGIVFKKKSYKSHLNMHRLFLYHFSVFLFTNKNSQFPFIHSRLHFLENICNYFMALKKVVNPCVTNKTFLKNIGIVLSSFLCAFTLISEHDTKQLWINLGLNVRTIAVVLSGFICSFSPRPPACHDL